MGGLEPGIPGRYFDLGSPGVVLGEQSKRFAGSSSVRGLRAGLFTALLLIGLAALPTAAAAQSKPLNIDFETNRVKIGPVDPLPVPLRDASSTIKGTVAPDGTVTVPRGGFRMPIYGIEDPVGIDFFMGVEKDATGTWDPETGRLELDTEAGIWASVEVRPLLDLLGELGVDVTETLGPLAGALVLIPKLTCGFSAVPVRFTTEETAIGSGRRFTDGLGGPGSLTVGWSRLGTFAARTKIPLVNLDPCLLIRDQIPSLLTGLIGEQLPIDLAGLDLASVLSNLDEVDLGPSSLTITRSANSPEEPMEPEKPKSGIVNKRLLLQIPRKPRSVRKGKATTVRAIVINRNREQVRGSRLCARTKGLSTGTRTCRQVGSIPASGKRRIRLELGVSRKARKGGHRIGFRVLAGGGLTSSREVLRLRVR
jgi:hypothetical protein